MKHWLTKQKMYKPIPVKIEQSDMTYSMFLLTLIDKAFHSLKPTDLIIHLKHYTYVHMYVGSCMHVHAHVSVCVCVCVCVHALHFNLYFTNTVCCYILTLYMNFMGHAFPKDCQNKQELLLCYN
jgi:hypothetical protein